MSNLPPDSAVVEISKRWRLWKRFKTEMRCSEILLGSLLAVLNGKPETEMAPGITAFQIVEGQADAWRHYFKCCNLWDLTV